MRAPGVKDESLSDEEFRYEADALKHNLEAAASAVTDRFVDSRDGPTKFKKRRHRSKGREEKHRERVREHDLAKGTSHDTVASDTTLTSLSDYSNHKSSKNIKIKNEADSNPNSPFLSSPKRSPPMSLSA